MKFLVVCILVVIVSTKAAIDDKQKRILESSKECVTESKVDPEILKQAHETGVFREDSKLKVHALCFGKKVGIINEKGDFLEDVLRERLNARTYKTEDVDRIIKTCLVKKNSPEDTALVVLSCFYKNANKGVDIV